MDIPSINHYYSKQLIHAMAEKQYSVALHVIRRWLSEGQLFVDEQLPLITLLIRLCKHHDHLKNALAHAWEGLIICSESMFATASFYLHYAKLLQYIRLYHQLLRTLDMQVDHLPDLPSRSQQREWDYYQRALGIFRAYQSGSSLYQVLICLGYSDFIHGEYSAKRCFQVAKKLMQQTGDIDLQADMYLGLALSDSVDNVDKWCAHALRHMHPLHDNAYSVKAHLIQMCRRSEASQLIKALSIAVWLPIKTQLFSAVRKAYAAMLATQDDSFSAFQSAMQHALEYTRQENAIEQIPNVATNEAYFPKPSRLMKRKSSDSDDEPFSKRMHTEVDMPGSAVELTSLPHKLS